MISIFVAYSKNRVIGKDNDLPWHIPGDLKRFKELTTSHTVIMGRKTYQSIVARLGHALPNRRNIITSTSLRNQPGNIEIVQSLEEAMGLAKNDKASQEIFIIGGEKVFRDSLRADIVDKIYATEVHKTIEGDAFFPEIIKDRWVEESRVDYKATKTYPQAFSFVTMRKKR